MSQQESTTIINALRSRGYTGNQANASIIFNSFHYGNFVLPDVIEAESYQLDRVNPIGLQPAVILPPSPKPIWGQKMEENDWYSNAYFNQAPCQN